MKRGSLYGEGEESHWQNDKLWAQGCGSRVYWECQTSHMDIHFWVCLQGVSREMVMRRKVPHTTRMAPSQRLLGPNERRMQANTTAPFFFLFLDHGSSVIGPIALITTMLFSHGGPCPFKLWAQKNPFSLKTTFAWNFVTETRNMINTKLKAQTQHPVIFSILWALIHWLFVIFNGNNTRLCYRPVNPEKKYMCIYSFDFMFTRDKCSLVKTVLCKKHHPRTVSMTSDPQRTAQISKNPHFCCDTIQPKHWWQMPSYNPHRGSTCIHWLFLTALLLAYLSPGRSLKTGLKHGLAIYSRMHTQHCSSSSTHCLS